MITFFPFHPSIICFSSPSSSVNQLLNSVSAGLTGVSTRSPPGGKESGDSVNVTLLEVVEVAVLVDEVVVNGKLVQNCIPE